MADYRALYNHPIDFGALALVDPDFANHLKDNRLDFKHPAAVKQLTISLLSRDFDLHVELPDDRLCPPVPNRFVNCQKRLARIASIDMTRLNYVLWIQNLLDSTSENLSEVFDPNREVIGLDVGTGSSCIYPLLGCKIRNNWRFIATDIDDKNLEYARANVHRNVMDDRIKVLESTSTASLIPLDKLRIEQIDFVMMNPPFFTSTTSMLESAAAKSRPPSSACTGSETEMVVEGGEVAFVTRIIKESLILRDRIQWYSAMLGKLESVRELLEILNQSGLNDVAEGQSGSANWAVTEFVQGTKTRRWALAWSWSCRRPSMDVARGSRSLGKQLLPFPSLFTFDVVDSTTLEEIGAQLNGFMNRLELRWKYRPSLLAGVAFAEKNVWSRAARRNKINKMEIDSNRESGDEDENEDHEPALAAKIVLKSSTVAPKIISVDIRWLIGRDSVLFESFCGMIKREIGTIGKNQA